MAIATGAAVVYFDDRYDPKMGDIIIHEEAARERAAQRLNGSSITHRLHPLHILVLVHDTTTTFWCNACRQSGEGYWYRCNACDFDLHEACATSDEILSGLIAEKTVDKPFVHEHPLTLASGSSHKCRYCKNKVDKKYRYYCSQCDEHFHLMCATHPTRLSSFLHPQHELELKTKHHFAICDICHRGGKSKARVYSCELCQFIVHSDCAVKAQYINHPLHHGNHTLVYGSVSKSVRCTLCKRKCRYWSYSCTICEGVHIHQECLYPAAIGESNLTRIFLDEFAQAFGENLEQHLADLAIGEIGAPDLTGQFPHEWAQESLGEQPPEVAMRETGEPDISGQFVDEYAQESMSQQPPEVALGETEEPDLTGQFVDECAQESMVQQPPEVALWETGEPDVTGQIHDECAQECLGEEEPDVVEECLGEEEPGVIEEFLGECGIPVERPGFRRWLAKCAVEFVVGG